MKTGPKPQPEGRRFWRHVLLGSGCWLWTGNRNNMGYGMFRVGSLTDGTRRKVLAHRWAFIAYTEREPVGDLDHTCHNADAACPGGRNCLHRRCVRPTHLRDTTRSENLRASGRLGRSHGDKVH